MLKAAFLIPPFRSFLRRGQQSSRIASLTHLSSKKYRGRQITSSMAPTVERVPSTALTREDVVKELNGQDAELLAQCNSVTELDFQQAINCCGFTSVAYALTAIGCKTSVDELFLVVGADVESAVGDGMTLAEIYDASMRYISRAKIPAFVECYHFDKFKATPDGFKMACDAEAKCGIDDLIVLNFHSGIAHGWASGGGGHFSVMAALSPSDESVIMADVHGIKYGSFWSTPYLQMFDAMADKDSCGRARGALRFGRTDKNVKRPLPGMIPTLLDWSTPPPPYESEQLAKYIPEKWDEGLGVKNMEGVSALSSAMRLLEGDQAQIGRLDEIMRALKESYTYHLNNFTSPAEVVDMANRLREKGFTNAEARVEPVKRCSADSLKDVLKSAGCGSDNVAVLVAYDFNEAYGAPLLEKEKGEAGALSRNARSWSLIAAYDDGADLNDDKGVVIAPAHNVILTGRLWTCSIGNLAKAMVAVASDECELVVIERSGK